MPKLPPPKTKIPSTDTTECPKPKAKKKPRILPPEHLRCKACNGRGKSSSGWGCTPCKGTGIDLQKKDWTCPSCGITHTGFVKDTCRNKECRDYGY